MPVDIKRSRALIAKSLLDAGAVVSELFDYGNGAMVANVLTEDDGAPACESCLPQTARAVAAAFDKETGWPAALDEIERLRVALGVLKRSKR